MIQIPKHQLIDGCSWESARVDFTFVVRDFGYVYTELLDYRWRPRVNLITPCYSLVLINRLIDYLSKYIAAIKMI